MWLKFTGVFIILLSGTGIGWAIADRYIYRVHYLQEFYQAINLINTEIIYNQTRLAEALKETAFNIEPPASKLFQHAADNLKNEKDRTFAVIWRELIDKSNYHQHDKKILLDWGKKAGSTKLPEQEKNNKITMEKLITARENAEIIADKKVKLARYTGVLISFLIIILCY